MADMLNARDILKSLMVHVHVHDIEYSGSGLLLEELG